MTGIYDVFWVCVCGHKTKEDPGARYRLCERCKGFMLQHNNDFRHGVKHGFVDFDKYECK